MFAITKCNYLPPITLHFKACRGTVKLEAAFDDQNKSLHVLITIKLQKVHLLYGNLSSFLYLHLLTKRVIAMNK